MSQVQNSVQNTAPVADENQLIAERRDKLKNLRAAQAVAFPNDFKPADRAADLLAAHDGKSKEELEAALAAGNKIHASIAGRMMLKRVMGKASFATLQDGSLGETGGRFQVYITRDEVGEDVYAVLDYDAAVSRRETPGGTGPGSVAAQLAELKAWLG